MVSAMDYEKADDRQLIEGICLKDRAALEALYTKYSGPVYSLAMHMLRDAGAAEEVAQDTFFNIWRRANSYKAPRGSVTSWLFSIAHNRTIDELRKRKETTIGFGMAWTSPTGRPSRVGTTPLNMRWPSSREAASRMRLQHSDRNSERLWSSLTSEG